MSEAERIPILHTVIPGKPLPKARPRVVNGHAYTPERTQYHEMLIAHTVRETRGGRVNADEYHDGRFAVMATFHCVGKRRHDIDNMEKCLLDGLTKSAVLWKDDRQVEETCMRRVMESSYPRTEVEVWRILDSTCVETGGQS